MEARSVRRWLGRSSCPFSEHWPAPEGGHAVARQSRQQRGSWVLPAAGKMQPPLPVASAGRVDAPWAASRVYKSHCWLEMFPSVWCMSHRKCGFVLRGNMPALAERITGASEGRDSLSGQAEKRSSASGRQSGPPPLWACFSSRSERGRTESECRLLHLVGGGTGVPASAPVWSSHEAPLPGDGSGRTGEPSPEQPGPAGTGSSSALLWGETRGGNGCYPDCCWAQKGGEDGSACSPDKLWPEDFAGSSKRVVAERRLLPWARSPARGTSLWDSWLGSTSSCELPKFALHWMGGQGGSFLPSQAPAQPGCCPGLCCSAVLRRQPDPAAARGGQGSAGGHRAQGCSRGGSQGSLQGPQHTWKKPEGVWDHGCSWGGGKVSKDQCGLWRAHFLL